MNHKPLCRVWLLAVSLLIIGLTSKLSAQGTAFTYQGHLATNGVAVTGQYDFTFALYTAAVGGNQVGMTQTNFGVPVDSGIFTTNLDFGSVFNGSNYWLSIGVTTNTGTNFTILSPRQQLLPVPYAIFATSASNLVGTLPASQISGALTSAQIAGTYTGTVTFNNSTNSFTGTYSGNGANLTNLNASSVASGTLADARLSGNVPLLNANNQFTGNNQFNGANSFTNRNNAFTGSFFGNGLVGWVPVLGISTQAVANTAYVLLNPSLTTVTLPPTSSLFTGDVVRVASPYNGGWQIAQNAGQSVRGIFLNPTNASWLSANASSVFWRAIASSTDGAKMVASAITAQGIYVSTDYGKTWNISDNAVSANTVASSADGTQFIAADTGGTVMISTNSGSAWKNLTSSGTPLNWSAAASSYSGSIFAVSISNSTVYVWSNFGTSSNFNAPSLAWSGVAMSSDGTHIAACPYGNKIYTSANSGGSWSASGSPSANWACIASSADGTKLAAAVSGGHIYTSTDSGSTWTSQANSPSAAWTSITSSYDGSRLAATVSGGGIYVSGNFGLTWVKQAVNNQSWYGIAASQDLGIMAAVSFDNINGGKIYYWSPAIEVTTSTVGTGGSLSGSPGSAVELLYIGNNQFMPISSSGTFWAN